MQQAYSLVLLGNEHALTEAFLQQLDILDLPISQLQWLKAPLAVDQEYNDEQLQDEADSGNLLWQNQALERITEAQLDWTQVSIVLLLENNDSLRDMAELAAQKGCWVLDLRQLSDVAKVIEARVNPDSIIEASANKWLACSSSLAGQLGFILAKLSQDVALEQVQVNALLSASHFGAQGVKALAGQTARLLNGLAIEDDSFGGQLAFNTLPLAGDSEAHLSFEQGVSQQVRSLLCQETLDINVSAVVVPVFYGDCLLVSLQSTYPWYPEEVIANLSESPYLSVESERIANPVADAKDAKCIVVSGVSRAGDNECAINLRIVANNPQLGIALNAALLVEQLIHQHI